MYPAKCLYSCSFPLRPPKHLLRTCTRCCFPTITPNCCLIRLFFFVNVNSNGWKFPYNAYLSLITSFIDFFAADKSSQKETSSIKASADVWKKASETLFLYRLLFDSLPLSTIFLILTQCNHTVHCMLLRGCFVNSQLFEFSLWIALFYFWNGSDGFALIESKTKHGEKNQK